MTDTTKKVIKEDLQEMQEISLRCRKYVDSLPESEIKQDLDLVVFAFCESIDTYNNRFGFLLES